MLDKSVTQVGCRKLGSVSHKQAEQNIPSDATDIGKWIVAVVMLNRQKLYRLETKQYVVCKSGRVRTSALVCMNTNIGVDCMFSRAFPGAPTFRIHSLGGSNSHTGCWTSRLD